MVLKHGPIIVPVSDAGLRLPRILLKPICKGHFEITSESAPHRLGNHFQVNHAFQVTAMGLHILVVVVVGHDLRRQIRNSQPNLQIEFWAAGIEIELRTIVEIEDVGKFVARKL